MRLSNRNKAPVYHFISTLLTIVTVICVFGYVVERRRFGVLGLERYLILLLPLFLWIIFYIRGRQIFEYDSDGEALNFRNRNIFPFLGKPLSDEFPKYKLLKFELANVVLLKRLYITISSKKSHSIVLKYDVSYLSGSEIKDLKISLNRVLKSNKENKEDKETKE